jgi:hypothetical protein
VKQLRFYEVRIFAPRPTPNLDGRVINYSLLFGIVTAAVQQWLKLCHVVKWLHLVIVRHSAVCAKWATENIF